MVRPVKAAFHGGVIAALFCGVLHAQQVINQPSFTTVEFAGPALRLACVAELKKSGEDAFVGLFRSKSSRERRLCLDQLLQSLTPEPDFSAEEFRRLLKKRNEHGDYVLDSPSQALTNRLGVNYHVAGAIAALARRGLIQEPAVLDPLVRCLDHPWLFVGQRCNSALVSSTGHQYGSDFFNSHEPRTVENHQRAVAEWQYLRQGVRRPIYDRNLRLACQTALDAVIAELRGVLPLSPGPALYFKSAKMPANLTPTASSDYSPQEPVWFDARQLWHFDVGRHNTSNWLRDEPVSGVTVLLFRPGNQSPSGFQSPNRPSEPVEVYRERFDALDLEARFSIGTSDKAIASRSVEAVKRGLAGLRALNAKDFR